MNGAERIARERRRQVEAEGYDYRHDDGHDKGELRLAAATYALPLEVRTRTVWLQPLWRLLYPPNWHFKGAVYTQATRQTIADQIRDLEKAGALCAAEIDRLERTRRRERRARARSGA